MKNFCEPDKKQQKLTNSQSLAIQHNNATARMVSIANQFVAQKPEFELRTLDNATLTKVCMALEARTAELLKQLKEMQGALP